MSKEYTYDIDKYTIGVDENGEDGIGMTVAKIENGGINFLGNCYGENARCIDLLIKENQELKKQYCERTDCSGRIGNSKKVEELQKENKQLKDKLSKIETLIINHNCDTGDIYYKYNSKFLKSELKQRILEIVYEEGIDSNE